MKIFIDTANIDEIRQAHALGIVDGVTTNPTLIAKEGRDFVETVKEICMIVDGPISAEAVSLTAPEIIAEAVGLAKIHKNIVVKIPVTAEGLKATKVLSLRGIRTNLTLCFSATQALLAAKAGATYVSAFIGRLDDISQDGMELVRTIMQVFSQYDFETKLIVASIRNPMHVLESARVGAHIATIPYGVLMSLVRHPLTDIGIERFLKDWKGVCAK